MQKAKGAQIHDQSTSLSLIPMASIGPAFLSEPADNEGIAEESECWF